MGHSIIPRDIACCEVTANLPPVPVNATAIPDYQESVFVVDDLTKHPDLRDRPYVTGYPDGRYYAGAPITTPSGTNIGAYCILDDKPRQGISPKDALYLRDMSRTVMQHLETVRALSERHHTNQMVAGLGDFVRGLSNLDGETTTETTIPLNSHHKITGEFFDIGSSLPDSLLDETKCSVAVSLSGSSDCLQEDQGTIAVPRGHPYDLPTTPAHVFHQDAGSRLSEEPNMFKRTHKEEARQTEYKEGFATRNMSQDGRASRPPITKKISTYLGRSAYKRAAEILCKSLRVDGVAFLDASVRTFGGLVESTETGTSTDTDDSTTHVDLITDDASASNTSACKVLGCAQTVENELRTATETSPGNPHIRLTESFIRGLMRRNPKGNI